MIPKFICHLLSGGLDSVTMLYDLLLCGDKVHCLLFNYGQRHVQELQFAKLHCQKTQTLFTTIEIPDLRGSKLTDGSGTWVVPFRNPILLSIAANHAAAIGADTVTFGANRDDADEFPDCRWAMVDALNHALKISHTDVELCAPYIDQTKKWIVLRAHELGVNLNEIWTCYVGGQRPCGECPACKKLKEAMA